MLTAAELLNWVLLVLAAGAAGAINAVAGGGTFLLFPALNALGNLSEKLANTTCTLSLWPGSAASVVATRADLRELPRPQLVLYTALSVLGGAGGALLLLYTPERAFGQIIPWLLGFGTVVFALSPRLARWITGPHGQASPAARALIAAIQFLVALYGGYFGAGIGILMLANLALLGLPSLNHMNAMKVWLATWINCTAVVLFIAAGSVVWKYGAVMAVAGMLGGYYGAALARRVQPAKLRAFILAVGALLTLAYAWKAYG